MMKTLLLPLFLACGLAVADESGDEAYDNQCHDKAAWDRIDKLLKKVPNDALVIRTYALRLGLCKLIQEKKISLETGMAVFDIERQKAIMERAMEDDRKKQKKPVPPEGLEPVS